MKWTLFDQVFFANSSSTLVPLSGGLQTNLCIQMVVVSLLGLPGYYVSVWLMDKLGRRNIQMQGFLNMAIVFLALGLLYPSLEQSSTGRLLMLLLYGLTFFFSNFGPNSTTFILPSETFPPHIRSTLNGVSAAMGKLGATLGSAAFKPLKEAIGLQRTMVVCAALSLCGLLLTTLFVEDRRKHSMEEEESSHHATTRALTDGMLRSEQTA